MSQATPKRMIVQYREEYAHEKGTMIQAFLEHQNLSDLTDYFVHTCCVTYATCLKFYLVIDICYEENPNIDPNELKHQVFKTSKNNKLYVVLANYQT